MMTFHLSCSLQLDLSQPLEEQGPLDVIIHKLTDLILEADQNDTQSLLLVQRVQVRGVQWACLSMCAVVFSPLPRSAALIKTQEFESD